jgi:hypothetical protein
LTLHLDIPVIGAVIGAAAGLVSIVVGGLTIRNHWKVQIQQSPELTVDRTSLVWIGTPAVGDVPASIDITLKNVGEGLATEVAVGAWLFMVKDNSFVVPSNEVLGRTHFSGSAKPIEKSESQTVRILISRISYQNGAIPGFDPDAVPVVKVQMKYGDRFKNKFEKLEVRVGTPTDYSATSFDAEPI